MQIEELYRYYRTCPRVSTDTRHIKEDSIFFALKGANFNGNAFADQALEQGARYAVIDEQAYQKDERYILVSDVLATLQDLATFHRKQLKIPIIGITGTNGKTTTKELLYAVLSQKYKTYATVGNLNNHIGVPLSLLAIDATYEIAIIEMGANHIGEIAFLSHLSQPTHGLITNVGKAHLEGFGSFEGVKKTKGELYDYLQDHAGTLFLQGDNPHLAEMASRRSISRIITYGFGADNSLIGKLTAANPYLSIAWYQKKNGDAYEVSTHLTGSYNTENFLAAIAVGLHFEISPTAINTGIANYIPQNNRSQITQTEYNTVIADFYNANASSMAAALENMHVLDVQHKVVILGDMFEMGEESYREHKKIIEAAQGLSVDRLIFIGKEFYKHKNEKAEFYETIDEAQDRIHSLKNSFILLKASRGMTFEKLLDIL